VACDDRESRSSSFVIRSISTPIAFTSSMWWSRASHAACTTIASSGPPLHAAMAGAISSSSIAA
jgi:hypothetical protein